MLLAATTAALSLALAPPADKSAPSAILRVLILPTINGEEHPREPRLDVQTLRAFSGAMTDAAIDIFAWRRWTILAGDEALGPIALALRGARADFRSGACRTAECAVEAGRSVGATHVLFSRLTRLKDGSCSAVIALEDLLVGERSAAIKEEIKPCSANSVLSVAIDLGHRIAEGPRAPVRATVSLTPLELKPLDVPDIPDVDLNATTTSTKPPEERKMPLDRALEIYKVKHMFVFEDPDREGVFYVARDKHVISDCDVRRAASAPITRDMLEYCEGNSWEYAWLAFPVGLLIAGLGANDLQNGGALTLVFGAAIAGVSAAIALVFNVDAADVEAGSHYSGREELERIVQKSNKQLREVLDLTEAEVHVAGMRR
jgi:hypothetical protein